MNTIKFIDHVKQNGGCSYNINTSEFNPKVGYFASIKGRERIVNSLNNQTLKSFILDNIDLIFDLDFDGKNINNFIGCWINDGKIYLDVSKQFKSRKVALSFAKDNNQLAIFDANNSKEIFL